MVPSLGLIAPSRSTHSLPSPTSAAALPVDARTIARWKRWRPTSGLSILRSRVSERERLWIEAQYANLGAQGPSLIRQHLAPPRPSLPGGTHFSTPTRHRLRASGQTRGRPRTSSQSRRFGPHSANNRNAVIYNLAQAGRSDEALDYYHASRVDNIGSQLLETGVGLAYMQKRDYDSALAAFRRITTPPELEREGQQLACGPLTMQGRFAEAAQQLESELLFDSMAGPSNHRETSRTWLAQLNWLMDEPALARLRASETAQLEALPLYLPFFRATAGLAFELQDIQLLGQLDQAMGKIARRWPSTYSNGTRALSEALLRWASGDSHIAGSFRQLAHFGQIP